MKLEAGRAIAARAAEAGNQAVFEGIRRLVDPKISLASIASMVLGAAVAACEGPVAWGWLALTVIGIFSIEVAKNASGELVDFQSGVDEAVSPEDRSPFSGGKRVLVEGLLTRRQTAAVGWIGYTFGIASGIVLAAYRHPDVLWLGLIGVGLAYFYHAAPVRLSYRGLGEIAVALTYGPLIACGTYLVQRREWGDHVWWVSLPLGVLIGAFLWINEFPDYRADRGGGKRTLVVRLGPQAASRVYVVVVAVAYGLLMLLPAAGLPRTVWLGAAGLPFSVWAARRLRQAPESTQRIIPAQACTLLAFLVYSIGVSIGMLMRVMFHDPDDVRSRHGDLAPRTRANGRAAARRPGDIRSSGLGRVPGRPARSVPSPAPGRVCLPGHAPSHRGRSNDIAAVHRGGYGRSAGTAGNGARLGNRHRVRLRGGHPQPARE